MKREATDIDKLFTNLLVCLVNERGLDYLEAINRYLLLRFRHMEIVRLQDTHRTYRDLATVLLDDLPRVAVRLEESVKNFHHEIEQTEALYELEADKAHNVLLSLLSRYEQ